jgi:hypothetical protein
MATAYYQSLDDADVIEVEFLPLQGNARTLKLLVDSGITGRSSVILGQDASDLVRAQMGPAESSGALHGTQNRAWVMCRITDLIYRATVIAIVADVAPLSLPSGVHGIVGLTFLRQFTRWGAERTAEEWRFYLTHGED